MNVKPAVFDGGHEIVLANWPNNKHVTCNDNNNNPIKIPSHPYVLINRTVLCNCGIEGEDNSLLESIAACPPVKQSDLTMYFTVNTAFMHYFDSLPNNLEIYIYKTGQCMSRCYQFQYKCLVLIPNYWKHQRL